MDTEILTEQIRKIVAQGMAGRVASIHTARAIVRLVTAAETVEPCLCPNCDTGASECLSGFCQSCLYEIPDTSAVWGALCLACSAIRGK